MIAFLALVPSFVHADDDLFGYLKKHASIVAGVVVVDNQQFALVEARVTDDFAIAPKWRGTARLGLFSITRAGEQAPPPVFPTTVEAVKAYSDGEAWLSIYRELGPVLSIECLGGVTFKMVAVTGQIGDPLDGTKLAGACGPRFAKNGYQVSILAGHFGPVKEAGEFGPILPTMLIHAYIPLALLGQNTAFVPDLAFGRMANGEIVQTLRLGIAARF